MTALALVKDNRRLYTSLQGFLSLNKTNNHIGPAKGRKKHTYYAAVIFAVCGKVAVIRG
jgi:hypothetical protein